MGLMDKIKRAFVSSDGEFEPKKATFATRPDTVYSPVTGLLVTLEEVNDEVVSDGLLGIGYGIVPAASTNNVVYSPVTGRIGATTVTNHAISIATEEGIEVLIHIGLGTVNLEGKPFTRYVEANQEVKAGEPLIGFDSAAIAAAGLDGVVVCVVSNTDQFDKIALVGSSNTLMGDRPLVKVGDPLVVAK